MTLLIVRSIKNKLLYSSIAATAALTLSGTAQAEAAPGAQRTIDEVTITARRREESAQETPIAVTALGSDELYKQNITEVSKLTSSVPGINFTASGGANNTVFSIRGRSRGVFGNALPAVTAYVNEVPLSTWGANIPTYDMSSLQVLKGPQGTLFGRNSTAGAVLATTERPTHESTGYSMVKIGDYNTRILEGAVTIPLIQDTVALRIAGQTDDRHGYTKDMMHPELEDYGNHDRENYRISLLIEPNESFSNLTIYEKNKIHERSAPVIPVGYEPGTGVIFGSPATPFGTPLSPTIPYYDGTSTFDPITFAPIPCGGNPNCDVGAFFARQDAAGPRKSWADIAGYLDQELNSASNTTTLDLGSVTIKNIFGYREVFTHSFNSIDGSEFPMINADNVTDIEQFSDELQISGEALDGALEYIGGLFWLKSQPNGGNRLALQLFAQTGTPITNPIQAASALSFINGAQGPSDYYTDTSKAAFGQISYDIGAGVSVDVGVRHTKDKSENCPISATSIAAPIPDEGSCIQKVSATFEKTTYNIGFNFQATDETLLYAVTRTGYRAGGVNSPVLGGTLATGGFQSYKPETVQDYEVGMKSDWSLGDFYGRFNLALYRSEFEDVHFAIPTQAADAVLTGGVDGDFDDTNNPSGGLFYGNAGEATVEGIEVDFIIQLQEATKLSLSGAYMDKEFEPQFVLPSNFAALATAGIDIASKEEIEAFVFLGAPRWSYNVGIEHNLPVDEANGEVILSARYFRMSEVHYGGNVRAKAYEITDIRADWYSVMGSAFDTAIYASNVFDKAVITGPSSSSAGLGFNSALYNEPRMWGASLRYNF